MRLDATRLNEGLVGLSAADPDLARAIADHGPPGLRETEAGFSALLRSILGQQVSIHAARSIWQKLLLTTDPVTPQGFFAIEDDALRLVGFSRQKIRYSKALAAAIIDGSLDIIGLDSMTDDDAIAQLIKLPGIGRWTAEIYLMFALGRPDILPINDLGLIVATQSLKCLETRPTPTEMATIANAWRPWRSVASLILWHYRHNMPDFAKASSV